MSTRFALGFDASFRMSDGHGHRTKRAHPLSVPVSLCLVSPDMCPGISVSRCHRPQKEWMALAWLE